MTDDRDRPSKIFGQSRTLVPAKIKSEEAQMASFATLFFF